jgi:hypothetical protein
MDAQLTAAEPTPSETAARLGWPRAFAAMFDYGVPALAVVFFLLLGIVFLREGSESEWCQCYVKAARRLQNAETIHRVEPVAYAYPPAMAMLAVPLANLPDHWSMIGWYAVNVWATCVTFACAWQLVGGPPLVGFSWKWHAVFWIGVLLSLRFLVAPLENHQTDMVIAALVMIGACRCWRGNGLGAGVSWGIAAAMKCTPLLFGLYLLWRGRWRPAIVMGAVALGLNLLPDLLWPQPNGGSYLADWSRTFLARVGQDAPGAWFSDVLLNQSLAGMVNRLATFGVPWSASEFVDRAATAPAWPPLVMRGLVCGTGLALLGLSVFHWGRIGRQPAPVYRYEAGPLPWHRLHVGLDVAMIVCLMLLLSPMSSKAHYAVLVLPSLFVARRVVESPTRGWMILLGAMAITGPLTAKGLLGKSLGDLTLAWGMPTMYVVLALLAMWRLRAEAKERYPQLGGQIPTLLARSKTPARLSSAA